MAGGFACPECGARVGLKGVAPGRQVRCRRCRTLIEVPFFPRAGTWARPFGRSGVPRIAWALCLGVMAFSLAIIGAKLAWRSRLKESQTQAMAGLRIGVDEARKANDPARLRRATEALLRSADLPWSVAERAGYQRLRDRAARDELGQALRALEAADPARLTVEGLRLWESARDDPALAEASGVLRRKLTEAAGARLASGLVEAEAALARGNGPPAMAAIERLLGEQADWPEWLRGPRIEPIHAVAGRIAARYGAVVAPTRGEFWQGSPGAYDRALRPIVAEALRSKGYVPEPEDADLAPLWERSAPYRLAIEVVESRGPTYLQSAHVTTQIQAWLILDRGDRPEWRGTAMARSRAPLPGLSAFESGRVTIAETPSPEFQKRLHDDAFALLVEQFGRSVRAMPAEARTAANAGPPAA